jgi:hypothetical protein
MPPDELFKGRVPLTGTPMSSTAATAGGQGNTTGGTAGYTATVLAANPKGYWKLGDQSGTTAVDSSGNNHPGTYGSGVTLAVDSGVDRPDDCILNHQTGNDYMSVPDHADFNPSTAISVEVWFSRNGTNGSQRVVQKGATDQGLRVYMGADRALFRLNISGTGREIQAFYSAFSNYTRDGIWHHLVCTWESGSTMKIWIDNVLRGESSVLTGTLTNNTDPLDWGRKASGDATGDHFDGYLDEAAFYGTALTPTQISSNYQAVAMSGANSEVRVTDQTVEALVTDTTPELRVTQMLVESVVQDTTPELRVTQVMVEAVVQQFSHYFGILGDTNDDVTYTNYSGGGSNASTNTGKGRSKADGGVPSGTDYRKNVDYRNNSDYRG